MWKLGPESEQDFLDQVSRSAKDSGKLIGADGIADFDRKLNASMTQAWAPRPLLMCLAIAIYRARLRVQEKKLAAASCLSADALSKQIERVESLRFASRYSRIANAQQRNWCLREIADNQIAPCDVPFLIWNRVISLKSQRIIFGHWDWIFGIVTTAPLSIIFLYAFAIAFMHGIQPGQRAVLVTSYLATGCGAFAFYKSLTFDVYRVGKRYFRPNGWRYQPLHR